MSDIRPSPIAGTWYPGNPETLRESIDGQLAAAHVTPPKGRVIGVVAPHAGHRYSGQVAAHAFKCFEGLEPDIIAIISPLHSPYPGEIFTTGHEAFTTPFGEVPVDHELLESFAVALEGKVEVSKIRHDPEHSLEIELPFLQRILSQPFRLFPLMILKQSQSIAESVGHALARVLQDHSYLLVASSDLSHFYPAKVARQFDEVMLSRIKAFDPAEVIAAEEEGVGFACGRGAIASVLWASRDLGADSVEVLAYAHSGDVTGDHHSVVGYGAAVIYESPSS